MKIITLDLTNCKDLQELHDRIRVAFDFPDWYGENWDAFWDLLRSECDADKVIVKGVHTASQKLDKHIGIMFGILERNKEWCKEMGFDPFSYEIE